MPRLVPLPPNVPAAFRVATARAAGLTEGRLRGRDLERPHHGVRATRAPVPDEDLAGTIQRCGRAMPLMSTEHFFSHLTAARLWGCPLPDRLSPREPLHISRRGVGSPPRRPGIVGHRSGDPLLRTVWRHGLPVSDAASTWLALATVLPLDELVVCADWLVLDPYELDPHDLQPYVTLPDLRERLTTFHGRGAITLARALALARAGVESRPETLLRLLLSRAGLPEPEVNPDIYDDRGRFIGRGDLTYRPWRTIAEYDGDQHRTNTAQYEKDARRLERFADANWKVVRIRKHALFRRPPDAVARVRRALESRGWRG